MDIEEFQRRVAPRAKRSRLEPFLLQILELKNKGYANGQIAEWLASNEIKVTQETVRKFIKRNEASSHIRANSPASKIDPSRTISKQLATQEEPATGSHNPATLDAILSSTPDLEMLSRIAKANRKKKI